MSIGELIERYLKRFFSDRITFDDGSYIQYFNREAIIYIESNKQLELIWYFDTGFSIKKRTISLDENFGYWDPPNETIEIGDKKRDEIIYKIKKYCGRNKIPVSVIK